MRDIIAVIIYGIGLVGLIAMWSIWQKRGAGGRGRRRAVDLRTSARARRGQALMGLPDANPPLPEFRDDYVLQEVDAEWLSKAVKPKQFIHIDQSECIMCEGCVDICPWKCIHMVRTDAIDEAIGTEQPGTDPNDHVIFTIDDDVCTRCALCVDRCPTGVIILGKIGDPTAGGDTHSRMPSHGYGYGMRLGLKPSDDSDRPNRAPRTTTCRSSPSERISQRQPTSPTRSRAPRPGSSIFRPGSIFRKGYTDSPRNRSYVIMNSVLYHLHPVKVKRHAVKVSYTLCLGGLSFFLFILLTVTGIFLMFFYRPTAAQAWDDIYTLQTSVTFGLLVRNMHRWAAHLMVLSVFLHMARVFYHGAYKAPREFNWVIGVILLTLTLLLSFTGYLLPWDQLALWAVTVGTNMMGYTPVFGDQVRFVLLGGVEIGTDTLLRWYVLHVLMLPFVIVIFMAIHFWRVRKDGGISGPL